MMVIKGMNKGTYGIKYHALTIDTTLQWRTNFRTG